MTLLNLLNLKSLIFVCLKKMLSYALIPNQTVSSRSDESTQSIKCDSLTLLFYLYELHYCRDGIILFIKMAMIIILKIQGLLKDKVSYN